MIRSTLIPSRVTLGEWLNVYMNESGSCEAETTIDLLLAAFGATRRLRTITPRMASEFRNSLLTGRRGEQTVRKHMRYCKAIFRKAVADGLIAADPFAGQASAVEAVDKDWADIDDAAMARIFAACPSDDWRRLFALCRYGCLRLNEALALEWADVGPSEFTVRHVGRQTTKKRERKVPIEPRLRPYLCGGVGRVCNVDAKAVHSGAARIISAAGVPRYDKPFHTLRKCGVTDWCEHLMPAEVAVHTGHSVDVLMKHYYRADASATADKLAKVIHMDFPRLAAG